MLEAHIFVPSVVSVDGKSEVQDLSFMVQRASDVLDRDSLAMEMNMSKLAGPSLCL